jgi:hypothetical protein
MPLERFEARLSKENWSKLFKMRGREIERVNFRNEKDMRYKVTTDSSNGMEESSMVQCSKLRLIVASH